MTLVLDVSSSMTWCLNEYPGDTNIACVDPTKQPIDYLREATKKFIDLFDEQSDQIAVVLFDTNKQVLKDMATTFNKAALVSAINANAALNGISNSNTDTDEGLFEAINQFSRAVPDPGAKRILVLMTDGSPNFMRDVTDARTYIHPLVVSPIDGLSRTYSCSTPSMHGGPTAIECNKQYLRTIETADSIRSMGIKFYSIGLGDPSMSTDAFQDSKDTAHLKPYFLRRVTNDPDGKSLGDPNFAAQPADTTGPMAAAADYDHVVGPKGKYLQTPNSTDLDTLFQYIGNNIKGRLTK